MPLRWGRRESLRAAEMVPRRGEVKTLLEIQQKSPQSSGDIGWEQQSRLEMEMWETLVYR